MVFINQVQVDGDRQWRIISRWRLCKRHDPSRTYTLGNDVLAQADGASGPVRVLLKDGHGSTRQVVNAAGVILPGQVFAYDAYGNFIGFTLTNAVTTHLYNGETFDIQTGLQYLRARYYDTATGRFNSLDSFAGSNQDPQSLHRYLYTEDNPVMGTDPSGMNTFVADLGKAVHRQIYDLHAKAHAGHTIANSKSIPGAAGAILPDIMDFSTGKIGEIKPASAAEIALGYGQLFAAINIANGIEWTYGGKSIKVDKVPHAGPQPDWIAEDWSPGIQAVFPGAVNPRFAAYVAVTAGNFAGLIPYLRFRVPTGREAREFAREAVEAAERLVRQFGVKPNGQLDPAT